MLPNLHEVEYSQSLHYLVACIAFNCTSTAFHYAVPTEINASGILRGA